MGPTDGATDCANMATTRLRWLQTRGGDSEMERAFKEKGVSVEKVAFEEKGVSAKKVAFAEKVDGSLAVAIINDFMPA
ncbi:hypothetical protein Tco_0830404 [Tanacetum coccineum]